MNKIALKLDSKNKIRSVNDRYLIYAGICWLIYLILFFSLKHFILPQFFIYSWIDDYIPFIKWFFIPYCLWYVYMFAVLIYFNRVSLIDFVRLQSYIFIGFGICLIVYAIYPNAISFRPNILKTDPITSLMSAMYSIDSSTMVTPSMHVFSTTAIHISLTKCKKTRSNKALITSSLILAILICSSTVFVKQHSIIDIFWGLALAFILYIPIYRLKKAYPIYQ